MSKIYDYTIKNNPVLSKESMKAVFKEARAGNRKAWEKIILSNISLVYKACRECGMPGINDEDFFEDMVSDGMEELILKAMAFNEERNVPFSVYIWPWIKQWVYRKNVDKGINMYREEKKLRNAVDELEQSLNRKATDSEIVQYTGYTEKKLQKVRKALEVRTKVSLDEFDDDSEDESKCLYNYIGSSEKSPEEKYIEGETAAALRDAVNSLSEKERLVISMRNNLGSKYDRELTLREVSEMLGISRETVRTTENVARRKIAVLMKNWNVAA